MLSAQWKHVLRRHACRPHHELRAALFYSTFDHGGSDSHQNAPYEEAPPPQQKPVHQSISSSEIAKFARMAETWWDSKGPFKPLHAMNPTRISFIRSALCRQFKRSSSCAKPLQGLSVLDVGCGGGLLCEPLARLGARVKGIDAVETNINIATAHSIKDPLTASIRYVCMTADELKQEHGEAFDAVVSLEVIEHVTDPKIFLQSLSALVKEDGALFLSTINRSIRGYFLAILAAEHILQWVPKGTHEWYKFITPEELALLMHQTGFKLQEMAGMVFNPLTGRWSLSEDTSVNYIAFGTKTQQGGPLS